MANRGDKVLERAQRGGCNLREALANTAIRPEGVNTRGETPETDFYYGAGRLTLDLA